MSSMMAAAVGHHGRTRQDGGSDDGYDDRRGQRADPRGGGGGRPALALVQVPRGAHYPSDVPAGAVSHRPIDGTGVPWGVPLADARGFRPGRRCAGADRPVNRAGELLPWRVAAWGMP